MGSFYWSFPPRGTKLFKMADEALFKKIEQKAQPITAHQLSIEELCKSLGIDDFQKYMDEGLTPEQLKKNQEKFGPNKVKKYKEGVMVQVQRDVGTNPVKMEDLVPGDKVMLDSECIVPADMRLIKIYKPINVESYFLYKDCLNYMKNMDVARAEDDPWPLVPNQPGKTALEATNLMFHGTKFDVGNCSGIVFQTGSNCLLDDVTEDVLSFVPEIPDSDDEGLLAKMAEGISNMLSGNNGDENELEISWHQKPLSEICEELNTSLENGLTTEQAAKNREISGKNKVKYVMNYTRCLRDGQYSNILTRRLTIGDVVTLNAPLTIPADIVVIKAADETYVDKTSMTGDGNMAKISTGSDPNPMQSSNFLICGTELKFGHCEGIVVAVGKKTITAKISGLGGSF